MGLADMQVQVMSLAHGGKGSGCCPWCDDDLEVTVLFEDGSRATARRFRRSPLGKGFARISVRRGNRWTSGVLTPRDEVIGRM